MNRYPVAENYLLQDHNENSEKFYSNDHSIDQIQNQEEHQGQHLPSVRKFLSQPNPLMNKIQFTPYYPKCYYPRALNRLPRGMRDFNCLMKDKNNLNNLLESAFCHEKLKKDVLNAIINKKTSPKGKLHTLDEYYSTKLPIYQRYYTHQIKIQENKLKLKYFATFVLDMAKIIKNQIKCQEVPLNKNDLQKTLTTRPASVTKSGNFIIKEQNIPEKPMTSHLNSRRSLIPKIEFDSNFESGNLYRVYQKQFNEYDLILQNDVNTKGNTQWFFFSVKGVPKNTSVKFNIVNMSKKSSLFNIGMKPCIFSTMRYQKRNIGWVREGARITYQESQNLRKQSSQSPYHELSFEYKFIYEEDVVYFSYSIPYTLSDLSCYLNKTLSSKRLHKIIKLKNLGLTIGSNEIDLLEITNTNFVNKNKKSVWIIARQHPGQTSSGFMIEGIIDYLISQTEQANILLNNFVFKIVPMVNIDGVVHGNSRAQFIGSDPNRKWGTPNKLHNPIIHSIKHYIQRDKDNIEMVLDLHSHSRKLGTFFYGNTISSNPTLTRIFPLIVCKNDQRYTFKNCRFQGGNNSAARYALYQALEIPLIYTIQCSFFGYQIDDHKIIEYFPQDYYEMGKSLMVGFISYEMKKNGKNLKIEKPIPITEDIEQQFYKQIEQKEQFQTNSAESDSDPGEDEYNQKQFKRLITLKADKKKKKNKKKKPEPKVKPPKQIQTILVLKKPKINTSESYYKQYFSGRMTQLRKVRDSKITNQRILSSLMNIKKETFSFGVQVSIKQTDLKRKQNGLGILTQRNQLTTKLGITKPLPMTVNGLLVVGQKVEEISIYGASVGIQASENKDMFARNDYEKLTNTRKSFSVRTRANSFLQVKENNFLQRGDCVTKNFFSRM